MPLDGEPFRGPDTKSGPKTRKPIRVVDKTVTRRAVKNTWICPICKKKKAASGHHVIPKGSPHFGDDVDANIVALCGNGTTGCHGDVEARRKGAREALGEHLRASRPDVIAYVWTKLGRTEGGAWLQRHYGIR